MTDDTDGRRRTGIAAGVVHLLFLPARAAVRSSRTRIEATAEDVLAAPEVANLIDRTLAGPLPEHLARSLAEHRVLERFIAELERRGELDRLLERLLASGAADEAIRRIVGGPELRAALARQTGGVADELVASLRLWARRLDARLALRPADPSSAGVATRALALGVDALVTNVAFASGAALVAIIGSLFGGIRPEWLAGALLAVAWALVVGGYFAVFWSAAGQTPGMRLLQLRVRGPREPLSLGRAIVRVVGLWLAVVPMFLGFVPVLFDRRRRGLPDYLAGTRVVYDDDGA